MAEEYGFFTSVSGDRKYNAAFMNRRLHEALQREDGILNCDQKLAPSLIGLQTVEVKSGIAMKGGIFYRNSEPLFFGLSEPAVGKKRRDRIAIHIDRYLRTMKLTLLVGVEVDNDPIAPSLSEEDDIAIAQIQLEKFVASLTVGLTDERQMRPSFLTEQNTIDDLAEGVTYGRVLKEKADAINLGQMDLSFRKFIYTGKAWSSDRYWFTMAKFQDSTVLLLGGSFSSYLASSGDNGLNWSAISGINVDSEVSAIGTIGYSVLVAGGCPARIFRCPYLGQTWTMVAEDVNREYFRSLLVIDSLNVIAACDYYVYGSVDGGLTWTQKGSIPDESYIMVFESLGNGILLAAGFGSNKIWRSTNLGVSWTSVKQTSCGQAPGMFIKNAGNGVVLFGHEYEGKLYRSTDYGLTWDSGIVLDEESDYFDLLVDGNKLWLPVNKALYSSIDAGATWTKEHELANLGKIKKILKTNDGLILTFCEAGYLFWGYQFDA